MIFSFSIGIMGTLHIVHRDKICPVSGEMLKSLFTCRICSSMKSLFIRWSSHARFLLKLWSRVRITLFSCKLLQSIFCLSVSLQYSLSHPMILSHFASRPSIKSTRNFGSSGITGCGVRNPLSPARLPARNSSGSPSQFQASASGKNHARISCLLYQRSPGQPRRGLQRQPSLCRQ